MPGHDPLGEYVNDERDIHPVHPAVHMCEVHHLCLIRVCCSEFTIVQIYCTVVVFGRNGYQNGIARRTLSNPKIPIARSIAPQDEPLRAMRRSNAVIFHRQYRPPLPSRGDGCRMVVQHQSTLRQVSHPPRSRQGVFVPRQSLNAMTEQP